VIEDSEYNEEDKEGRMNKLKNVIKRGITKRMTQLLRKNTHTNDAEEYEEEEYVEDIECLKMDKTLEIDKEAKNESKIKLFTNIVKDKIKHKLEYKTSVNPRRFSENLSK